MRSRFNFILGLFALGLSVAVLAPMDAQGDSPNRGLTQEALDELQDIGDGWVKHTFDPDGGDGPICIAGTPFSAFTRAGNPAKVLILLRSPGATRGSGWNLGLRLQGQPV